MDLARDGSLEHRLARRANALILLDRGMSCVEVAQAPLLDDGTVRTWHKSFLRDGVDLETGKTIMCEDLKIGTLSTLSLLKSIEARYQGKRCVHVFLDNAKCHHALVVREWMSRLNRRIKLHVIPPYTPNLNPVERLWGVMHRAITHNQCYEHFRDFAQDVSGFLRDEIPKKWDVCCDKITDNFRVISQKKFRVITQTGYI